MNLAELRLTFWDYVDDPHQTLYDATKATRLLNRGMEEVGRTIEDGDSSYLGQCREYAVTPYPTSELMFDLPTDYKRTILGERVVVDGVPVPATWTPFARRHLDARAIVQQVRGYYAPRLSLMGKKLIVVGPSDAYTLRLWYSAALTAMSDEGDTPSLIPSDFHELIALVAAKRATGTKGKPFGHEDEYQRQLASLVVMTQPRQRQTPRHVHCDGHEE